MNDLISRQSAIDMCRKPHMRNADCSDFEMEIMMLPSAQLEQAVKDCRNCKHGKYNDYHDTYFCYNPENCSNWEKWETSAQPKPRWVSCFERLPDEKGEYLITLEMMDGTFEVDIERFNGKKWNYYSKSEVTAWTKLPEAYKAGSEDNE